MPINRIFHQPQQMSDPIILRKHPRYIDAPTNGFHLLACPVEALAFHPEVGGHYQVSVRGISENNGSVEVVCVEHPFIGDTWIIKMEDTRAVWRENRVVSGLATSRRRYVCPHRAGPRDIHLGEPFRGECGSS
jgi:hypothetical protein